MNSSPNTDLTVCPICLQQLPGDLTSEGLENHKRFCKQRAIEETRHQQEVADVLNRFKPMSFEDVAQTLGCTVKRDRTTKILTFAGYLLTYTEMEQINLIYAAESAAGKSWIPEELAAYFPDEDVVTLGGASPTTFIHEATNSKLASWDAVNKETIVNLSRKILIFLDQPSDLLLQKMRAFLSHDKREIVYKYADRSQKAGLRTRTTRLVGFATWAFCSTMFNMDEQERNRNLQLSPETTTEKILDAEDLLLERKGNRDAFRDKLLEDLRRQELMDRIRALKDAAIRDVVIPPALLEQIRITWREKHPKPIPRHIRDLDRLLSLIKSRALLNFALREQESSHRIIATFEDVEEVTAIYDEVARANEMGLAPQALSIFEKIFCNFPSGIDRHGILSEYFKEFHRSLSPKRLEKEILPALESSGLVSEEADPSDKRRSIFYPHPPAYISSGGSSSNNVPPQVGVNEDLENPPLLHPRSPQTN